jgi:hypothetical protein
MVGSAILSSQIETMSAARQLTGFFATAGLYRNFETNLTPGYAFYSGRQTGRAVDEGTGNARLGIQGDDMITIKIIMLVMLIAAIVASAYATERSDSTGQTQT